MMVVTVVVVVLLARNTTTFDVMIFKYTYHLPGVLSCN